MENIKLQTSYNKIDDSKAVDPMNNCINDTHIEFVNKEEHKMNIAQQKKKKCIFSTQA